jgi:hypothetical protein
MLYLIYPIFFKITKIWSLLIFHTGGKSSSKYGGRKLSTTFEKKLVGNKYPVFLKIFLIRGIKLGEIENSTVKPKLTNCLFNDTLRILRNLISLTILRFKLSAANLNHLIFINDKCSG